MKNNYEVPATLALGRAQNLICGTKDYWPNCIDHELGAQWRKLTDDIDESDE